MVMDCDPSFSRPFDIACLPSGAVQAIPSGIECSAPMTMSVTSNGLEEFVVATTDCPATNMVFTPTLELKMSTKDELLDFPPLAFEQMHPSFLGMPGRTRVAEQGGLHWKRLPHHECTHLSLVSASGGYILKNGSLSPHYSIPACDVPDFISDHQVNGANVRTYEPDSSYTKGDFYRVINYGTDEYTSEFAKLLDQLNFPCLLEEIVSLPDAVNKLRNAKQVHVGWTSGVSLSSQSDGTSIPNLRQNLTVQWKVRGKVMTQIADLLSSGIEVGKLFNNPERNKQFAAKIHVDCRIEAMTGSLTDLLKIHLDLANDDSAFGKEFNYNYLVAAWRCYTVENKVYRVAILGYSRKSVGDSIHRRDAHSTFYADLFNPWYESLPQSRKSVSWNLFDPSHGGVGTTVLDDGKPGMKTITRLPHMNKAVYLSAFADIFLEVQELFYTQLPLQRLVELLLPVAFSPSAHIYRVVLQGWIDKKQLPESNLSVQFVDDALKIFPSLSAGDFKRHQPTFNTAKSLHWFYSSLRDLYGAVLQAKKMFAFDTVLSVIIRSDGIGHLLGQTLLHVAALVGLVPSFYANTARTCPETKTSQRLKETGFDSTKTPSLMKYISAQLAASLAIVENALCEFGRPPKHPYRDTIYFNQQRILYVEADLGRSSSGMGGSEATVNGSSRYPSRIGDEYKVSTIWRDEKKESTPSQLVYPKKSPCLLLQGYHCWWGDDGPCSPSAPPDKSIEVVQEKVRLKNQDTKLKKAATAALKCLKGEQKTRQRLSVCPTRWGGAEQEFLSVPKGDKGRGNRWLLANRDDDDSVSSEWQRMDRREEWIDESEAIQMVCDVLEEYSSVNSYRHLRSLHAIGHRGAKASLRLGNVDGASSRSLFHPTAELVDGNCQYLSLDLPNIAAKALGLKASREISVEITEKGRGRFAAVLHARLPGDGHVTSPSRCYRLKKRRHALKHGYVGIVDGECTFRTKHLAKEALYWYVFSVAGEPGRWLCSKLQECDWSNCSNLSLNKEAMPAFVILGNPNDGTVFCTLMKHQGQVWARMQHPLPGGELYSNVFRLCRDPYLLGSFPVTRESLPAKMTKKKMMPIGQKEGKVAPIGFCTSAMQTKDEVKSTPIKSSKIGSGEAECPCRPEMSFIPDGDEVYAKENCGHVRKADQWSKYWPVGWEKILRIRQSGTSQGSIDSYWVPPGQVSLKPVFLRSLEEVRRFLDLLVLNGGNSQNALEQVQLKPGSAKRRHHQVIGKEYVFE